MQLNENLIREIIKNYQEDNQNKLYINKFIEETYFFIQKWPKIQFRCNDDLCSDFLVYIIESVGKIMVNFPIETEVMFKTWFSGVLYNKFNDFVKIGEISSEKYFLEQDFKEECYVLDLMSIPSHSLDDLYNSINKLSFEDASLLLFYYLPNEIRSENLEAIANITGKNLHSILLCYQELINLQNINYHQKEYCYRKLKLIDHNLSHMKNIFHKAESDTKKEFLKDKIARFENKRHKCIRYLKKLNQGSMKIFQQLFTNYDTAYRKIKKLERQIKKLILE